MSFRTYISNSLLKLIKIKGNYISNALKNNLKGILAGEIKCIMFVESSLWHINIISNKILRITRWCCRQYINIKTVRN